MRTLKIVVALLLAVAGVAGCSLFGQSEDQEIQQILDENASFGVILRQDATEAQRRDVEAALRALPGFEGITFVDRNAAYRRFKLLFSAEPEKMPEIEPDILPESFQVDMTDIASVRKIREDESQVTSLPGVEEVSFPCTTVRECREMHSPKPTAAPS